MVMVNSWTPFLVASAAVLSTLGIFIWKQKRKVFMKVGKISNLYFFPVKSLKAIDVNHGRCTPLGFEVNGVLDRSFMLIDEKNVLVSQRQCPSLVLLTPAIDDNFLMINGTDIEPLRVEILKEPPVNAKVIDCTVHTDSISGVDCGEVAALWFQKYLNRKDVRLVQYFPSLTIRKYTKKDAFFVKLSKEHPIGFQDFASCHVLSQSSVDDLNSKIGEKKVTVSNFRPNVLVDECGPYDEDSWQYIKFGNEALLQKLLLTSRCLMTTNDIESGILSKKEPLVTLRKYRIPSDPALLKLLGSIPCFGIGCAVLYSGVVKVGDEVFAVVEEKIKMQEKF